MVTKVAYHELIDNFVQKAVQWAKALKLLDPSIKLILCGETGYSSWDHHVLQEAIHCIDMHSIHIYTASKSHMQNVTAPLSAEHAIGITTSLIDLARIERNVTASRTICFDEWNVWDPVRAPGDKGAEEVYTLSDALAVSVWLGVFVRQARHVGMANIAQSVNVISPLLTTKNGLVKQTTYWPLYLFSRYMRGSTIATHTWCPRYDGSTEPAWLATVRSIPLLDVSACVSSTGAVSLAVTNISETQDFDVDLAETPNSEAQVFSVAGESPDVINTEGNEKVRVVETKWDGRGSFHFTKLSFTLIHWQATGR